MAAGNVAMRFGANGICKSINTACASSNDAIGDAFRSIKFGFQDIMLVGGSESSITPFAIAGFQALTALSTTEDPTRASIPFDKDRNGFVMGEGSGMLVLESLEHAENVEQTILAEVVGYGFSSNGGGISQPSDEGSVVAMTRALKAADMEADDIDYINAHATSTHQGDMYEAIALNRMFGGKHALISSTKSMTGHECWMAGASEAVYSILMMQHNFVAPNINFENPDEHSEKMNLATTTVDTEGKYRTE